MLVLKLLAILPVLTKSEVYLFYRNKDHSIPEKPIIEIYNIEDFQYIVFSLRVTWHEAKVLCSTYNGQLVKIDTMAKAKNLIKKLEYSDNEFDHFWIGGYKPNKLWIWIDKTNISINPTNGFPPWQRKPPRESNQCLAMDRYNHSIPIFIDLNCNSMKSFICEKELNAPINEDILLPSRRIPFNNKVFLLYSYKTTWYKASGFCRMKGYRLAIIKTNEEVRLLAKSMIQNRPSFDNVWIAGYHYQNYWRWLSTGRIISNSEKFPPWYQNHINRTTGCVILDRHLNNIHNFAVTNCQNQRNILCETYDPDATPENDVEMVPIRYQNCNVFLVARKLTWSEAFSYCSNRSLYLAETEDDELLNTISETMGNQILEMKHLWLGGKFNNSNWVWATSGKKLSNLRIQDCIENEINNTNHCLNFDADMHNKPKLYGIKCESPQVFVCMENACKKVANKRGKYFKRFGGKRVKNRRRRKMVKTHKITK